MPSDELTVVLAVSSRVGLPISLVTLVQLFVALLCAHISCEICFRVSVVKNRNADR